MIIYMLHQQIIYFSLYWLNGLVYSYIHVIMNVIVSIIISMLIGEISLSFRVTKFLVGE